MKTTKFLWALLPAAAVLLMTACGGDDTNDVTPTPTPNPVTPETENVVKSLPYSVTVNTGDVTRTSVDDDNVTLRFEADDKLYVQSDDGKVYGCLTLISGEGERSALFGGTLTFTEGKPAADTPFTATLVGKENLLVTTASDKVTAVSYPGTVCASMNDAVSKYSLIRGTGTYGTAAFTLYQETAFLKFSVTLEDGTSNNNDVSVVINSDGSTIGSGTVKAKGSQQFIDITADFVLPLANDTEIAGDASMWVGSVGTEADESITFGTGSTVTLKGNKVYPVTRTKDFVRLWAGGPVWSTRNLGAASVTDYGNYYAWGETKGYVRSAGHDFGWSSYTLCNGSQTTLTKYNNNSSYGTVDKKTKFADYNYEDDAARVALGEPWCMPTTDKFTALLVKTNTTNELTTVSGVKGKTFTGNTTNYTGKAIFLPATGLFQGSSLINQDTGCYWSSSLYTESGRDSRYADVLNFTSSGAETVSFLRCYGRCIRPVRTN